MSNIDFKNLKSFIIEKKYESNVESYSINFDYNALESLSQIYLFLSIAFRYPSKEVYNNLSENLEHFKFLFEEYLGEIPVLPPHEDLEPEYVSLFIAKKGGAPAPLYASVYTDDEGLLLRDSTVKLKRIMANCGFEINKSLSELEDNLFIILEFIYSVLQIIIKNDLSDDETFAKLHCAFIAIYEYLNEFVDEFASKVNEFANFEFYKQMAFLLKEFISESDEIFEEIIETKKF